MKHFIIITAAVFLLASCVISYADNTVINNHSSRTVTVQFLEADVITLEPGESTSIETLGSINAGRRIQSFSPERRVYFVYTNAKLQFDFFDRASYEVRILNLTGRYGTLSCNGGWMDAIHFSASNDEQADANWLVYRSAPQFRAITNDGFPLQVLFLRSGNVFRVTIGSAN